MRSARYDPFPAQITTISSIVAPTSVMEVKGDDELLNSTQTSQYLWLIIIPLIILFSIGKYLYERQHNTPFVMERHESICARTEKFFEEERKYRQVTETLNRNTTIYSNRLPSSFEVINVVSKETSL